jgi:crossover junction endodeoxyribonuclease RuvC
MFAHSGSAPRESSRHLQGGPWCLGIDPGLTRCGYAVIGAGVAGRVDVGSLGVFTTPPTDELADRLLMLHHDVVALLDEVTPQVVALERVFFQHNANTAMGTAQASAIVLLAARERSIPVFHYTPSQVKLAVAGSGSAEKAAIRSMVRHRLGLSVDPQPTDAADAAAVALCHIASAPLATAISGSRR